MKTQNKMSDIVELSYEDEFANTVSHALMAVLILLLLPYLSIYSYLKSGWTFFIGSTIFLLSLFFMFLSSTLYHAMSYETKQKYFLRIVDHSMIFVAIAGTYTPVALTAIGGNLGLLVVITQWSFALFGISCKVFRRQANPSISVLIYLIMGWLALLLVPVLIRNKGINFVLLIALGGILYSIGTFFYMKQDRKYFHLIWHLFINLATITHIIAIICFM